MNLKTLLYTITVAIGFSCLSPMMAIAQKIELRSAKIYIREAPAQWDKAMAQLEIAMEKDPGNNEVYYLLGVVHLAKGNFEQFVKNWDSVVFDDLGKKEKEDFLSRLSSLIRSNSNSATQSFNNKEYADAANFYSRTYHTARIQKAAYLSTGKKNDVEHADIAEQAEKIGLLNWGYSIYNSGDLENAAKLLEQYVEIDPQNTDVWDTLMRIHYNSENWQKTIIACNKLIDLADDIDVSTYMILAGAYFGETDTTSVIATYERAMEAFPEEKALYRDVSSIYDSRKDHDKAIEVLEKGHSALPEDIELLRYIGATYYNKGLAAREAGDDETAGKAFQGAVDTIRKLLDLQPKSIDGHDIISDAYFGLAGVETDEAKKEEFSTRGGEHQKKKLELITSGEGI